MENNSVRSSIFGLIKNKFGNLSIWNRIESDLALMCSELHEPITDINKKQLISQIESIVSYLKDNGVENEDLNFLNEEIDRHRFTKTISLYVEEEDGVDESIIEKYARLGSGTEGVVGIHQDFNYTQLSRLTNGVYKKTGLIKFYISKEKKVYGKIVAEVYDYSQKIPIATMVQSKKKDKDTGEPAYKKIYLFGEKYSPKDVEKIKEINIPFYVYRMITEQKQELILFTTHQCDIGDYVIEGVVTQCDDYKMLTDSAKLPTKLPFMFAQTVKNRIIKYKNHKEFEDKLKEINFNRENAFEFPFTIKKKGISYKLLQPTWYKHLIWSWLLHESKGIFNNYPLHIMVLGPKHSGKSLLLNGLHLNSKENRDVFSGSSSTMKSLIPSFKYNPAKLGYLAEANRFAYCDEFLRCITNTRTSRDGSDREESVALMNDLLEHQKRQAGSGISSVNVNMTARVIATTNPVRGIRNVDTLINTLDESFLSRWLIYYQNDEHIKMIRDSQDSDLEKYDYDLHVNDWISIIDYLHTFSSTYDNSELEKIHSLVPTILSENLMKHYDARHKHHLECLIDGVVKMRCILDGDMSFIANDDDYRITKEIWTKITGSWVNTSSLFELDIDDRVFFAPEKSQFLYWKIHKLPYFSTKHKIKEILSEDMNNEEFEEAFEILKELELITDDAGIIRTHYSLNHN